MTFSNKLPLSLFCFLFARNESKHKNLNVNAAFEIKLSLCFVKKELSGYMGMIVHKNVWCCSGCFSLTLFTFKLPLWVSKPNSAIRLCKVPSLSAFNPSDCAIFSYWPTHFQKGQQLYNNAVIKICCQIIPKVTQMSMIYVTFFWSFFANC